MAMFLRVGFMQWGMGAVTSAAQAHGLEPFAAVMASIGTVLALAAAFVWLPAPPPTAALMASQRRNSPIGAGSDAHTLHPPAKGM